MEIGKMHNYREQLKPCPFCGNNSPNIHTLGAGDSYYVKCGDIMAPYKVSCGASTSAIDCRTPEEAVQRWNQRVANTSSSESEGFSQVNLSELMDELARRNIERSDIGLTPSEVRDMIFRAFGIDPKPHVIWFRKES